MLFVSHQTVTGCVLLQDPPSRFGWVDFEVHIYSLYIIWLWNLQLWMFSFATYNCKYQVGNSVCNSLTLTWKVLVCFCIGTQYYPDRFLIVLSISRQMTASSSVLSCLPIIFILSYYCSLTPTVDTALLIFVTKVISIIEVQVCIVSISYRQWSWCTLCYMHTLLPSL